MSIKLELPEITELKPRIAVIGVGGAGGNAINNMISSGLDGVEFVVANTDAQALALSSAERRIQLGVKLTEGLGAGSRPEIGNAAAEEAINELRTHISGSHMVFIAAGMGGGTGTGAASVVARVAQEEGALTVGVVTKPFLFEGGRRMRVAEAGIEELKEHVDTLIVIPNQNLFRIASKNTTFAEAFVLADQVLHSGIACITDLIVREGLINLDFADVKVVMSNMGAAMMGMGEATGENRAVKAAELAIANPLLDGVTIRGARGLVISIAGGKNLTLFEVDEAASRVRAEVDPDAHIIVGATFDDELDDGIRVSILASGLVIQSHSSTSSPVSSSERAAPAKISAPVAYHQGSQPPKAQSAVAKAPKQSQVASGAVKGRNDGNGAVLKRKLTDALRNGNNQEFQKPMQLDDSQAVKSTEEQQSADIWKAPGNVTIETGPPNMVQKPVQLDNASGRGEGTRRDSRNLADAAFKPQAPSTHRKVNRRMPGPDDFPIVGQRELQAKGKMPKDEATPKKQGFFQKLKAAAGITKSAPIDDVGPGGDELDSGSIGQDSAHRVQPIVGSDDQISMHARENKEASSPMEGGDDIDFPMIFQDRAKNT